MRLSLLLVRQKKIHVLEQILTVYVLIGCSYTVTNECFPPIAALYSPVRAVPLRPRLHSPNGHRLTSPRQPSTFQPIAASLAGKPSAGPKTRPSSQTVLGSSQSQRGSLPISSLPDYEHLPSAARQLQIIALSSGRQSGSGPNSLALQPLSTTEPSCQKKKSSAGEDGLHLPPDGPKAASPIPSPPSLLSPASPQNQTGPQTQPSRNKCDVQEPQEKLPGPRVSIGDQGSVQKGQEVEKEDGGEQEQEEEEGAVTVTERKDEETSEEEQMKVTEEGENIRVQPGDEDKETAMDQSESQDVKPTTGVLPAPEASLHSQQDQPVHQEDCEDMSTQSDNQSGKSRVILLTRLTNLTRPFCLSPAVSSLSSQSPPASPSLTPPAETTPALLPAPPTDPTDLSLPQRQDAPKVDEAPLGDLRPFPASAESLSQSEHESESLGQSLSSAWEPKAWPEGRQVLTHLVDGFVIQEGLQPFPVRTHLEIDFHLAASGIFSFAFF